MGKTDTVHVINYFPCTSRNDIAMLYSLIRILYASLLPERVLQFWGATPLGDARSLSYREITEMFIVRDVNRRGARALYDMLLGLAKGQQCSELAHNFLAHGGGEVIPGSSLPTAAGSYNIGPSISCRQSLLFLSLGPPPLQVPARTNLFTNPSPALAASFGGFGSLAASQPSYLTQQPT